MDISQEAKEKVQAFVSAMTNGWSGNDNAAILAAVNTPSIANPVDAPTISTPYTYVDLLGHLSSGSIAKLVLLPSLPTIVDSINSGNLIACDRWIATLVAGEIITSDEATALGGVLTATEPDPTWPSQIPWSEFNLGRLLDLDDIEKSRPQ